MCQGKLMEFLLPWQLAETFCSIAQIQFRPLNVVSEVYFVCSVLQIKALFFFQNLLCLRNSYLKKKN